MPLPTSKDDTRPYEWIFDSREQFSVDRAKRSTWRIALPATRTDVSVSSTSQRPYSICSRIHSKRSDASTRSESFPVHFHHERSSILNCTAGSVNRLTGWTLIDQAVSSLEKGFIFAPQSCQSGNGFRIECRKASIEARTLPCLTIRQLISCSSAIQSPPYHSGGISSASPQTTSFPICSIRESQGSNECQPRTPAYTSFPEYTPRNGSSGKVHSPALKQFP
jgi:hypothetical protein